jgi:recombination endonuclease VII
VFSHRDWSKKRYAENSEYREKRRAAQRRYRASHKEQIRERRILKWENDPVHRERERTRDREWHRKRRFQEVYGISLADYDLMLARQRGVCAICKRSGQVLCVDHCHATGKVRGLLCSKCNSTLGFCDDDPKRLLAAIAYLRASHDDE